MNERISTRCTAFAGNRRIASGELGSVALAVKNVVDQGNQEPVLVFDDSTSALIELDLRGTAGDVTQRLERAAEHAGTAGSVSAIRFV